MNRDTNGQSMPLHEILAKFKIETACRTPEQIAGDELALAQRRAEWEEAERVRKAMKRRQVLEDSGVPERIIAALDNLRETDATKAMKKAAREGKALTILSGGVGCGKSVAAARMLDSPVGGFMVRATTLVRTGIFGEEAEQLYRRCTRPRVLVIDDLGTEPLDPKGYGYSAIYDVIEERHANEMPTVITTNLDLAAFKARYGTGSGERLIDRIREDGTFIALAGESLRKKDIAAVNLPGEKA